MNHDLGIGMLDIRNTHRKVVILAVIVILAHGMAMVAKYALGYDMLYGLVPLFDLYEEHNVPTYFSSLNLLLTAGLLYLVAYQKRIDQDRQRTAWLVLCFGFLFMSIDEFADLRIVLSTAVKAVLRNERYVESIPFFSVAWTIPVTLIVIGLAFYFIPFVRSLKRIYAMNFAAAGAVFVFAAIVLETLGGHQSILTQGVRDLKFMMLVTLEETLEICSILYFQYFLIRYLDCEVDAAAIDISALNVQPEAAMR